ncbi:MAG TPA: hypothetical protein DG048_04570 [Pseudoalteromonas sp.]|nr:hypothetical protein [Pseudoalteromonas sp.]|tara:strand:+ start:2655 stop:3275 length:621 start_codon:yes stop_codon:yes gene_type:complete
MNRNDKSVDPYEVKNHFINVFTELSDFFVHSETIEELQPSSKATEEAVVSITIGQMLSRKAATTIYGRVEEAREREGVIFSMELPDDLLLQCGISARKVRTIRSFHRYWKTNKKRVEQLSYLDYESLRCELKNNLWGFADWSIAMLAIFHFAHNDVYPKNDGTLKRALVLIQQKYSLETQLQVEKASPYSSYLALYMWQAIDNKLI